MAQVHTVGNCLIVSDSDVKKSISSFLPNAIGGMALAPVQNASKFGKVVCVVFSEKQVIKLFHQDYVEFAPKN